MFNNGTIQAGGKGSANNGLRKFESAEERSRIINEAISSKQPIYAEELRQAYNKYGVEPKDDLYDVAIHGASKYLEYEHTYEMDAETLAYIISGRRDYKGHDIRLLSCNTGVADINGNCVAQQLANRLKVRVYAPKGTLNINPNGKLTVGRNNLSEKDGFRWFDPK